MRVAALLAACAVLPAALRHGPATRAVHQGTELINSGEYNNHFERGEYACAGCCNIATSRIHAVPHYTI